MTRLCNEIRESWHKNGKLWTLGRIVVLLVTAPLYAAGVLILNLVVWAFVWALVFNLPT